MTLEEQIKAKEAELKEARNTVNKLVKQLSKLREQEFEASDLSTWEKFNQWVWNGGPTEEVDWIQDFYIEIDTPEGYETKFNIANSIRYDADYGSGMKSYGSDFNDGRGRGSRVEIYSLVEYLGSHRRAVIKGTPHYFVAQPSFNVRRKMREAAGDQFLDCSLRIPLTLEHFDQMAEIIKASNIKSYEFDW